MHLERPDGARIDYEVRGEGPLVVLSLGFAATPATYEGLVADLARDHRVLTWEPRGCGSSSDEGPFPQLDDVWHEGDSWQSGSIPRVRELLPEARIVQVDDGPLSRPDLAADVIREMT